MSKKITNDAFLMRLIEHNSDIECLEIYKGMLVKLRFKCRKCGNFYCARPADVLSTPTHNGCPKCHRGGRKTHQWFISEMNSVNSNVVITSQYHTMNTKVGCMCRICGHIWSAIPINLLKGRGCPICNLSHGERKIAKYLSANCIDYIPQYSFDGLVGLGGGLLSYDFYLPKYNMLIEYQGEFHNHMDRLRTDEDFKRQQMHDERKKEYAQNHNINLIEIWYYDFDKIEDILANKIQHKMIKEN